MKEIKTNGLVEHILQAIEEMKAEESIDFSLERINFAL